MSKKKYLTYEELMDLALEHYAEGGDQTYECADRKWYEERIRLFGPMTEEDALEMFAVDKAVYEDIAATAWW